MLTAPSTAEPSTFCNTYTYPVGGVSYFGCGTDFGLYTVQEGTTTPGVTSHPPWVTTTFSPVVFSSAMPGPNTLTQSELSVHESTNELGQNIGKISAAAVGGAFGLVILIGVSMYFCLRKRSGPRWAGRSQAAQEYGEPLIDGNERRFVPSR